MSSKFRSVNKLRRLTNDILDATRIESQTLKLNKEQFNIIDLTFNIIEDFKNDIQEKGIDIKLSYEPFNHHLLEEADKGRIAQVISNLFNNAISLRMMS